MNKFLKEKIFILVLFTFVSLVNASCRHNSDIDDSDEDLGKTEKIDISWFSAWSDGASYSKDTFTSSKAWGCCGIQYNQPKGIQDYNFLEIDYEVNASYGCLLVTYSDESYAYAGLPKGSNKAYVRLNSGKTIYQIQINIGDRIPYICKIKSLKFCEKAPSYVTEPVVDNNSKTFNSNISAKDYVKNLMIGTNFGSAFESSNLNTKENSEKAGVFIAFTSESDVMWHNEPVTKEFIQTVHKAGFDVLRLPVTWYNHIIDDEYTIDPVWMAKVKRAVDWAIEDGMYVMLNEHHSVYDGSQQVVTYPNGYQVNKASQAESERFLKAIWKQICTSFNNGYDEHLMFETMNEPRNTHHHGFIEYSEIKNNHCATCIEDMIALNSYNQVCVDTIRASGGNNAQRFIVVPSIGTCLQSPLLEEFSLPKDSANDKLILDVHDYYFFQLKNYGLRDGETSYTINDSDKAFESNWYDLLNEKFISKNIPILITETNVPYSDAKGNLYDRESFYDYFLEMISEYGIRLIWWDDGYQTGGSEYSNTNLFNRNNLQMQTYDNNYGVINNESFVSHLVSKAKEVKSSPKQHDNSDGPETSVVFKGPVTSNWYTPYNLALNYLKITEDSYLEIEVSGKGEFKFTDSSHNPYVNGTVTGSNFLSVDPNSGDAYGNISFNDLTITYKPSEQEWKEMREKGLYIKFTGTINSITVHYY